MQRQGFRYWNNQGFVNKPWALDVCMKRLTTAKEECIKQNSTQPMDELFTNLCDYVNNKRRGDNATECATAEASRDRIFNMFFTHYESWYTQFKEELDESQYPF